MKIIAEKTKWHRFAFYSEYSPEVVELCRSLKEAFGWQHFTFDQEGGTKKWVFSQIQILEALVGMYPNMEVDAQVRLIANAESEMFRLAEERAIIVDEIKGKEDTSFRVKGLKGEPYAYQNVGIEFLAAAGGRAIIADAPGLGKTLQALGYAVHGKFGRVLVVCPASVKFSWEAEVKKWTKLNSFVLNGSTKEKDIPEDAQVWIVNYDVLKKHLPLLTKVRFDCLIGDEAHMVKNPTAMRTKAFRQISQNIPHVVLLTGTPILSRPIELYSLLNIVDGKTWTNYYEYARRYCNARQGRFGLDVSGSSNEEELHARIARYFIRRRKDEVLSELPPKNHIKMPLRLPDEVQEAYDLAESNLARFLKENRGKQPKEIAKTLQAEKLAQLNALRVITASGKIPTAKELIESIMDAGEKVLVFSSFVDPLKEIEKMFPKETVMITGETPVSTRGDIVGRFQNDPNVKIFLGGFKSAGTGITLTAAQNVIFLDYSWCPADHQQAEDRAHRPGATAECLNIYQLHALDTIDEKLHAILEKKQAVFDQVIDGQIAEDDSETAMSELLKDIETRKMLL